MSSSTTLTSSNSNSSSSNATATTYRVNYSDYVANITNSPKSTRKLPSANVEHHITVANNTNTIRGNQTSKTPINMPHYGGGNEKCARCSKTVYLAERRMGAGRPFHVSCYNCLTCRRKLETATLSEHKGEIYCKTCYTKKFGAHGLISGTSVSTEKTVREYHSTRRSSFGSDLDAPIINYQETRYRSSSSDNLLREDFDKPTRRESNQQPSRTIDVNYESQSSTTTRKPSSGIVVVDTTFQLPFTPIKTESNTNDHRFQPIPSINNDRDRRGSQGDGLTPSRGTSAFVDIPVVIQPRNPETTIGKIEIPVAPVRDDQSNRSRSPSPSAFSNDSFQRQNSRNQDKSMTDSYSRISVTDSGNHSVNPYSSSNNPSIVKITQENPLVSEGFHRSSSSSSTSSATYERKYQTSVTNNTTYGRDNYRIRDSSPISSIPARRSPSPTGSHSSSSTIRTSTTTYREGVKDIPVSPLSTIGSRSEYHRDSSVSNNSTSTRRSPSPTRSSSALNDFINSTNLAGHTTTNTNDKFSTLRALAKPRDHNESDDDFDS